MRHLRSNVLRNEKNKYFIQIQFFYLKTISTSPVVWIKYVMIQLT